MSDDKAVRKQKLAELRAMDAQASGGRVARIRDRIENPPKRGAPGHVPTPTTRRLVQHWTATGLSRVAIARLMGMNRDTLYKHYGFELDNGIEIANANVAANLYRIATSNTPSAAGAAQYWLNRRSEAFRESAKRVEMTGKDGAPIQIDQRTAIIDVRKLGAGDRDSLRAILLKARDSGAEAEEGELEDGVEDGELDADAEGGQDVAAGADALQLDADGYEPGGSDGDEFTGLAGGEREATVAGVGDGAVGGEGSGVADVADGFE